MRHRVGFKHLAVAGQHSLELIDQPRLAGSGLRHCRDNLAVTVARQFERALQLGHFAVPADELSQSPPRCQFEMAAQRSDARHLVDIDLLADPFDFGRPEVAQFEVALGQAARVLADYDATRGRD